MKQVFIAADGTHFETSAECEAYEAMANNRATIEKWALSRYGDKQGQAKNAANKVIRWEMDRAAVLSGDFEYVEHPKKEKAKEEPEELEEAA